MYQSRFATAKHLNKLFITSALYSEIADRPRDNKSGRRAT